ncbi:unnamed protein product, partial [Ectocarpus sp. 12 AP-2014]
MEDVVEALTPRTLAERALLAPLRDVGTMAGALRSGVGSSLREMAAARAAKDLSDLIRQEAESSAVAAAAAAAAAKGGRTRKASPSRRGGGVGAGGGGGLDGAGVGTKPRGGRKKKKPKKKRGGAGGTGSTVTTVEPGAAAAAAVGSRLRAGAGGRTGPEGGERVRRGGEAVVAVAPSDGGFSSDSSDGGAIVTGAKRATRVQMGAREGEGDESLDDEEEQRGVVKKLRWRTEVGRTIPSTRPAAARPPAGVAPVSSSGNDDGFVSPLDLRRKAKLRGLAHALVLDTVEAALAQCKPPPPPPSGRKSSTQQPPPPLANSPGAAATVKRTAAAPAVAAGTTTADAKTASRPGAAVVATISRTAATAGIPDAPLSARRWPSPEQATAHPLWKIPAVAAGPPEPTIPPDAGAGTGGSPALDGAAVTPRSAAGVGSSGSSEDVRSPSLVGSRSSPRPPPVSRRREGRRELAVNDADERMSCSSFDSLDVRVDDQDFADILDMAYRPARMPAQLRAQQRAAAAAFTALRQPRAVAPGYFISPSSPRPRQTNPGPPPALPTAAAAAFHHHGMALDWRNCYGGRGGGTAARRGDDGASSTVATAESDEGSAGNGDDSGATPRNRNPPVGGLETSVGRFAPQMGGGSTSFFGGQGLFMWPPSMVRRADERSGAWGGRGGSVNALGSWGGVGGGGGAAVGDGDASLGEESEDRSPEPGAAVSTAQGEEDQADQDLEVAGPVDGKTTTHENAEETEEEEKEEDKEARRPMYAGGLVQGDQNHEEDVATVANADGEDDGDSRGLNASVSVNEEEKEEEGEEEGKVVPDTQKQSGADALPPPGDGDLDDAEEETPARTADPGGDGAGRLDDGHDAATDRPSPGAVVQKRPSTEAVVHKKHVPIVSALPAASAEEDDPEEALAAPATDTATGAAAAADQQTPFPAPAAATDTASTGKTCCSCACHVLTVARVPPTPPRRLSRRQQRRRASAPEKQAPLSKTGVSGGNNNDAAVKGHSGMMSSTASVPSMGRVRQTRAPTSRNLSEESRRPPILAQHQPAMLAPNGADGGGGRVASPDRKHDYSAGTPPRTERPQPRSASRGRGGGGGGGGGTGGVGGGSGSCASTPAPRPSANVRRRSSESGLGSLAAVTTATTTPASSSRYSDGYPGSAGGGGGGSGKMRSKRASSESNASNVAAAAAATGGGGGGTPPAWTWKGYLNNGSTGSAAAATADGVDAGGDGHGWTSTRGRSGSDAGVTPLIEVAGWDRDAAARGGSGQGRFPWRAGRVGGGSGGGGGRKEQGPSMFRCRGGSWDSDPRDGFDFRVDRDLNSGRAGGRASTRSAPKRVSTRRIFPGGARSMSEAAVRRLADPVQRRAGTGKARAGWSSDGELGDTSVDGEGGDQGDQGDLFLRVYPGEDTNSVGLSRSLGEGFDDSFVSDGGLGGIGEGDNCSLNTPRSGVDFHPAAERDSHDGGEEEGGGRYQDFGGARFQQVVRDRRAASASHHGGGTPGGARRSTPFSSGGGEGYGYGGYSE